MSNQLQLARMRGRLRHRRRMQMLGLCRGYDMDMLGADPKGFEGLAQLRRLLQGKSYIPRQWAQQLPAKRRVAIYGKNWKARKPPSKYTKETAKRYKATRTAKPDYLKKLFAYLDKRMITLGVPPQLRKRVLDERLRWIKEARAKRGLGGALKIATSYVKKAQKVAKKSLKVATEVVGPAIATVYPPAAPLIQKGIKLLDSAQKGVEGAVKQVNQIAKNAGLGDPKAKKALDVLQAARTLQKQVQGETKPAPGAVAIDRARLLIEVNKKGLVVLDPSGRP